MENWIVRDKIFSEENMYAKMMNFAKNENLTQTAKALPYAREKHTGQTRKSGIFSAGKSSSEKIPYIIHPLMMACDAHAMGLRDDAVLASILLHDVCEDCGIEPAELPFSEEVQPREVPRPGLREGGLLRAALRAVPGENGSGGGRRGCGSRCGWCAVIFKQWGAFCR